jgi:hypothetical protein
MALVEHWCPECGTKTRVIATVAEVFHYCPKKQVRGRPQPVTFRVGS